MNANCCTLLSRHLFRTIGGLQSCPGATIARFVLRSDADFAAHAKEALVSLGGVHGNLFAGQRNMRRPVRGPADSGVEVIEANDLAPVLPEVDVVYMTRIQKERFQDRP